MKKTIFYIVFFIATIWTASAAPLNLEGIEGPINLEEAYLIDSSTMPGLFYDDEGSTTNFEVLSITPLRTIFSNKCVKYADDFETDKWSSDSYLSSNVSRSVNGVVSGESVIYPTVVDEQASVKYNIDFINAIEKATITVTGTRRDTEHDLSVWVGNNNTAYTRIIEFEDTSRTTEQADITSYLQDNQIWIEFRFLKSNFGDNSPRILDFSIEVIYEDGVESPVVNNSMKEWQPIDVTTGGNIELPTRTIDRDHFYYFAPHYPSTSGPSKARVAYLGTKYPAIDINSQRAVLGSFIKNDADIVLTYGTPLSLGSGFVLEIEDMGKEDQAVVALKKDGKLLDKGIFEAGKTYSFRTEVAGVEDTELFKADVVSVLRSEFYNRVELKHVYLLDTEATVIKDGESFGDLEVDLDDFDTDGDTDITIRLKKDKTFTLDSNSTIDLFGGLSIRVADSDELHFAVIKNFIKSGTYQQTGSYGRYGQTYSINSFDAPGLFTYDMDKNDTLESLSISSSKQIINDIRYSSINKNNRISYLGKTYQATPVDEMIILNEVLADEEQTTVLRYGSPIHMHGFTLEMVDIEEQTTLLRLKKGSTVLEDKPVGAGEFFVYKKTIERSEVEIFNVTIKNSLRSKFAVLVELEDLLLLNDSAVIVKKGDAIGSDYEADITDINGDTAVDLVVKLKAGKSFGVSKDSTTEILGGYMSLKAYENTFLPVRSVAVNVVENTEVENLALPETIATPAEKPVQAEISIKEQVNPQKTSATDIQGTVSHTVDEAKNTEAEPIDPKNPVIFGSILVITLSTAAYGLFKKMW